MEAFEAFEARKKLSGIANKFSEKLLLNQNKFS